MKAEIGCRGIPVVQKNPAGNYLFKVNNRNTGTRCELCSKLTIKNQNDDIGVFGVFIVNFEYISHLLLVFLLLTLSKVAFFSEAY